MSVSISPSVEEIYNVIDKLAKRISNYRNEPKDTICLGLSLIYKNIEDWYNEINDIFSPDIAKSTADIKDDAEREARVKQLVHYVKRKKRQPAAKRSIEFLVRIQKRYEPGKLRNLINQLDMEKIAIIKDRIKREEWGFIDLAIDQKSQWKAEFIRTKRWDVAAEKIDKWMDYLDSRREEIREAAFSVIDCLDCKEEGMDALYAKLKSSDNKGSS
jgi:hypothetical protein